MLKSLSWALFAFSVVLAKGIKLPACLCVSISEETDVEGAT